MQLVDSEGMGVSQILFSFLSLHATSNTQAAHIKSANGSYNLDIFAKTHSEVMSHYIFTLDTTRNGVVYLFEDYAPLDVAINEENNLLSLVFDTHDIASVDISQQLQEKQENEYVRFVYNDAEVVEFISVNAFMGEKDMGIVHKRWSFSYDIENGIMHNFNLRDFQRSETLLVL